MAKTSWKSILDVGGHASTLWGILPAAWQTFITAGLTTVTAYFGFKEVGWAWALFLSSGVLAFGMTTVFLSLRISQILGVFQRITIVNFGISSIFLNEKEVEIDLLNMNYVLRNDSQRPMFYKLTRGLVTIERQGQISTTVDPTVIVIPAFGGTQLINLATVEDIPAPKDRPPEGDIEVELDYGSDPEHLDFHLREVVKIGISIVSMNPVTTTTTKQKKQPIWPPGQKHAQLNVQVKVLEHSRAS